MKNSVMILCSAAALWSTAAVGNVWAAVADNSSESPDPKKINACMAMSPDALTKDSDCTAMMRQKNVTVADMQTMKTCRSMKPDLMAQDDTCVAMVSKHPDLMRPASQ